LTLVSCVTIVPVKAVPRQGSRHSTRASAEEKAMASAVDTRSFRSAATLAPNAFGVSTGYMSGFGNSFETEALPGALPVGRNSPQKVSYGLYAEQLSRSEERR